MKLIQRIGYYLGGFSIGLVILAFFLNGKKVSCDYGPEARVLKSINSKPIFYNINTLSILNEKAIDKEEINLILKKGNVNFSKSEPRKKPCGMYNIEGILNEKNILLVIENCDSIITVNGIKWMN